MFSEMDLSLTNCKICNQEHTIIGENTDNLWKNLCMLCKHEIKRTNQFLAQLEKSSAFLISTTRVIESVVKTEPDEQIGGKNIRLYIDSDKIILAPELSSAFPFIEDNYSFCEQNSSPIYIKIEQSDNINLETEAADASPFIEDNYSFYGQNSPPMDIEYVGVEEENISAQAKQAGDKLLPEKSRTRYQHEAILFKKWQQENRFESVTEDVVMAYIDQMSEKYAPNSLYTKACMLKTMLLAEENIDIGKFEKVNSYLRQNNAGYKPKKSKTLSQTEVLKFLNEAPDHDYLMHKVVLIFGIFGACRRAELTYMKVSDIEDRGSVVVVNIPETKNYKKRSFCLLDDNKFSAMKLYRKYAALRPKETSHDRFFLCYKKGRCNKQVVGKNSIGNIPCKIATYLGLVDAYLYTGHCLRRTSATQLVNETGDILSLKRLGDWESTSIAEGYTDNSMKSDNTIIKLESNQEDFLPEEVFKVEPSRDRYRHEGDLFKKWQQENQMESVCENVIMAYIDEMSKKYAPTSLYTKTYMLKTMLLEEENIDIGKFEKVNSYLRQNAAGYVPKRSKTLSQTEVLKFLKEAPDDDYLMQKVVFIFGIFGACRRAELTYMKVSDIEDRGSVVVVSIPETKNYKKRSFCLLDNDKFSAMKLYRKYAALRPKKTGHDRFFLCYKKGQCTKQVVGKNSIGNIPCKIATYLGLADPNLYTGHCMRRTSATKFIDEAGDIVSLKRLGDWESTSIAGYVDESTVSTTKIFKVESRQQDFLPEEM